MVQHWWCGCPKVTDAKLMELGLAYGDILAFRQTFPEMASSSSHVMSYEQRSEQLKKQIKRNHSIGNHSIKIKKTVKVTFSLKYFEKNNFVCKRNQ